MFRSTSLGTSRVKSPEVAGHFGTAEEATEKGRKGFLQGLKPVGYTDFTPGLKPRPPKEKTISASCKSGLSREPGMRLLLTIRQCKGAASLRPIAAILLVFLFLPFAGSASAQSLRIAAASDLQFALADLAEQYGKQSGAKLAITYGSSGNFFAQIQNGAPFDLFFSADIAYPQKLIAAGSADADSFVIYAYGHLVIWLSPDSPIDLTPAGFRTLLDPRIQKIAIANPEHAPYGRAAIIALRDAGIYDQVKSKLILGENISQAAQFVQSGGAQAGILAMSLTFAPAMKSGRYWEIPRDLYPPLEQAVVLLKSSPNKPAARAFLAYLQSDSARATLARYGFTLPVTSELREAKP
jgi:molybdate transport system substrate-binding protein